jgi:hypothetical protein
MVLNPVTDMSENLTLNKSPSVSNWRKDMPNLDGVNSHVVQGWMLVVLALTLIATGLVPPEVSGSLFGLGLGRLERVLEKPGDKQ